MSELKIPSEIDDGSGRRLGIEIEVADVDVEEAARIVASRFGGEPSANGEAMTLEVETELGTFRVERDSTVLKEAAARDRDERTVKDHLMLRVVSPYVPTEIVTPPLPLDRIDDVDAILVELEEAGARGTEASPLDGFGLHLNPDAPSLEPDPILRTIQAFLLLRDWLRDEVDPNFTRRAFPHIGRHGRDYVKLVLSAGYGPDLDELVADYLRLEPSRNRELDMLPLFAHVRPDAVEELGEELVKARPTYHYRLPDLSLGKDRTSVGLEWRRWRVVEQLAADEDLLGRWMRAWEETNPFTRLFGSWRDECEKRIA